MVLTSPRAYNVNCAPQSSQYSYTIVVTKGLAPGFSMFSKRIFEQLLRAKTRPFTFRAID